MKVYMQIIHDLKKESTALTVFLNAITFGIYGAFYLKTQTEKLNTVLPEYHRIPSYAMYFVLSMAIVSGALGYYDLFVGLPESMNIFDGLITFSVAVSMLVWVFSWRSKFYVAAGIDQPGAASVSPLRMNGFLLFLFGIYYVNYRINVMDNMLQYMQPTPQTESTQTPFSGGTEAY